MGSKEKKKWTKQPQPKGVVASYIPPVELNDVPTKKELIGVDKEVRTKLLKQATQPVELIQLKDIKGSLVEGYRGIKNQTLKKVVSVVSDKYELLPNKTILDPVLDHLSKSGMKWTFDRFSYVSEKRMRIHFTFHDFKIKDDTKEGIVTSIFLHNSYDAIESYKMDGGMMRLICSNGMVAHRTLKRVKFVHKSSNLAETAIANIQALLEGFHNSQPLIEAKIKEMISQKVTVQSLVKLSTKIEAKIFAHLMKTIGLADADERNRNTVRMIKDLDPNQIVAQNQWVVFNILTQYISHITLQRYRLDYIRRVSNYFGL